MHSDYQEIASSPYFKLSHIKGKSGAKIAQNNKLSWIIPVKGTIEINTTTISTGDCGYASFDENVIVSEDAEFLLAQAV